MMAWYQIPQVRLIYTVAFNTPAFLGGASQQAAWRTPPFKTLLRQWWRVRVAREKAFNHQCLLQAEKRLFGGVHGDPAQRSQVMMRLDDWSRAPGMSKEHLLKLGDVSDASGRNPVDGAIYLGFGPVQPKTAMVSRSALYQSSSRLTLLVPATEEQLLRDTVQLAAWFGALGSRSRNGWGSLVIDGDGIVPLLDAANHDLMQQVQRTLDECLSIEWPHALGSDAHGPLIWSTEALPGWKQAMRALAGLRRQLRGQFDWSPQRGEISKRHVLAYPVTKHPVPEWDRENVRLPNQLRLKVTRTSGGKFVGLLFHFPHRLPTPMRVSLEMQKGVWKEAHQFLDKNAHRLFK